jgi:hypothetical protein
MGELHRSRKVVQKVYELGERCNSRWARAAYVMKIGGIGESAKYHR